jgi:hypothetical protein
MTQQVAALGVAPHSGWAAVVALGRTPVGPRVLARSRIALIDAGFPESKQPYHAVEALRVEEAAQRLKLYQAQAERMAHSAILQLNVDLAGQGYRVGSAGILESSGRKDSSLKSILGSHALIHAADGDHFRGALASAAGRIGLAVHRIPARDLDAQAEIGLHRSVRELTLVVMQIGKQAGPPWGADQKKAALLAWLLLETPG